MCESPKRTFNIFKGPFHQLNKICEFDIYISVRVIIFHNFEYLASFSINFHYNFAYLVKATFNDHKQNKLFTDY